MTEMRAHRDGEAVVVAWLTHPVTCLALLVLLVNDHVLKAAWGNAVTGKLSDFAWLLVAPPLLATLLMLGSRLAGARAARPTGLVAVSLGVTGGVFALVKTTAVGAATASAVLTAVAGPSVVLRDPTDLMALAVLWIGWRIARPSRHRASSNVGRPGWRWMVLLPLAVLATAATSVPPPQNVSVVAVIDEQIIVRDESSWSWYVSNDGVTWDRAEDRDAADELEVKVTEAGGTLWTACAPGPAEPLECYRAGGGLSVERSDDGGATWAVDWLVPEDVVVHLASRYRMSEGQVRTVGLAILPTKSGYQVWAANGGDGLAMRHEDGTWERVGFAYEAMPPPVVPLPGWPTRVSSLVLFGLPYGVLAAALVCLIGFTWAVRRISVGRSVGAAVILVVGAIFAGLAAGLNGSLGAGVDRPVTHIPILGGFIAPAVFLLAWAGLAVVVGAAAVLGRLRLVGPMGFAVVGVTLAAQLPAPGLAVAVSLAVVTAAAVVARRLEAIPGPAPASSGGYWE